ncbi:MAG TPA: hypothetical protein VFQ44_26535 [Streptosporangiaceae bacterium]|nr:hypothetical protein [Streptosporangiaceae bacterium]
MTDAIRTYWRRRFIVLLTGLLVFGLAAWGLSTAITVHPRPSGHAGSGRSAGAGHHGQPHGPASGSHEARQPGTSGGHGKRPGAGAASPSAATRSAGGPSAAARSAGGPSAARSAGGPSAGRSAGPGAIRPAFCARNSVVISIYTGQTQFARRQWPVFDLNVVSTQRAACSFTVGSRHLALLIKKGRARIWSSADCLAGTPGWITALGRGVPKVLVITWNRRTSAPGCSGRALPVAAGVYTAYATDDGLTSEPVTIRLN